ncbi:MAG TPA: flagellin, partial [Rhodocyclaceae bacterium]|nr:flagellin [Rhodocyclaceae bacterium]
ANLVTAVQAALNGTLGAGVATASTITVNGGTQLVITRNTTGATSSVTLSAAAGNSGLATMFGTPVSNPGTAVTAGTTYYDLVDASTGNSLFTGTASTTAGAGTTYTRAYTAGSAIPFSNLAPPYNDFGASVTITGTPNSGDSFYVKASATQSVFKTIASLVGTLENANTSTSAGAAQYASDVGSAIANIDQAINSILTTQTSIGSRQAEVTATNGVSASVKLQYQKNLSNLQDLDMAQAITQYTQNQTSLQAAQQSFAKITQLSLFNYL